MNLLKKWFGQKPDITDPELPCGHCRTSTPISRLGKPFLTFMADNGEHEPVRATVGVPVCQACQSTQWLRYTNSDLLSQVTQALIRKNLSPNWKLTTVEFLPWQ